ncbi:hypothetical protein M3148_05650 [Georgenia satyanarayanai]|uniref:GNAT family N-acetyltransferase n=1 Tax=Georgenia satyanarayanai TaxID=860221 RepID=UPI00203BB367|nr:hypothetical protein [Georgenia satyanarayanai]MCM3660481.1 hypothetical protein [Georgenia satyanarayanai]
MTAQPHASTTPRLDLEWLRVEHAEEMAPLLDDVLLHTYIGGTPATLSQLQAQYRRQVVGRSADGTERWLNWVLRRREDGTSSARCRRPSPRGRRSRAA